MILFIDALTVGDRLIAVEAFTSRSSHDSLANFLMHTIRPNGWTVPASCPIRHDFATRYGVRANVTTTALSDMAATAMTVVIHGKDRVMKAIQREREVDNRPAAWVRAGVEIRCTARCAAAIVKVPNPAPKPSGDDQWLLPTLNQCREHFGIKASGVDAVAELHDHLIRAGALEAA